jgi:tRNA(Ile2) C34 agmatinyltransferase TiaS
MKMADLRSILIDIRNGTLTNDDLNLIIEAVKFKRTQNGREAARTLRIGEQVTFTGKNGTVVGRLEQIKIKKAIVVSGFTRWNVPLSMLEAA